MQKFLAIIEDAPDMENKYKRLSDGLSYSKAETEIENEVYVLTQSAQDARIKIRAAAALADLSPESIIVELI